MHVGMDDDDVVLLDLGSGLLQILVGDELEGAFWTDIHDHAPVPKYSSSGICSVDQSLAITWIGESAWVLMCIGCQSHWVNTPDFA